MTPAFLTRAVLKPKGHHYEDFEIGRRFEHHWGRTLNHGDNSLFTTLTLHFNPLYTNVEFAKAHGHPDVVVNPMLVFLTVFGLTVEDLSEGGGAFLGVEGLGFAAPVYPGDTLTAVSTGPAGCACNAGGPTGGRGVPARRNIHRAESCEEL